MTLSYRRGAGGQPPGQPPKKPPMTPEERAKDPRFQASGGQDFFNLANPGSPVGWQSGIAPYDFRWLPNQDSDTTRSFAFTFNTFEMGLNHQREHADESYAGMSESTLLTHHGEAILPLLTNSQADVDIYKPYPNIVGALSHTTVDGRLILAGGNSLWAETSTTDSTLVELFPGHFSLGYQIATIAAIKQSGIQRLAVGFIGYTGISPWRIYSDLTTGAYTEFATDGIVSPAEPIYGIISIPLSGDPIMLRGPFHVYLVSPPLYAMLDDGGSITNTISGAAGFSPLGITSVGGRPARVYFREGIGGQHAQVSSVNLYGGDFQVFKPNTLINVTGAGILRDGLVIHDRERVTFNNGREWDTRIFKNTKPVDGFSYIVAGVYVVDNDVVAEVNLVPETYPALTTTGDIRRAWWRLDFERGSWSQVSSWKVWSDVVYGSPIGTSPPATTLPWSPSSRNLYAISYEKHANNPVYSKYEPPAATNPFSLRDGIRDFETEGEVLTPGFIFDRGYEFYDKTIDAVEWAGEDTGGTGSSLKVEMGEYGRMDETGPGPLHHTFNAGLSHASRRMEFPSNQTALLFPQFRFTITQGSDTKKTLQALSVTITGHVDIPARKRWWHFLGFGRSKG